MIVFTGRCLPQGRTQRKMSRNLTLGRNNKKHVHDKYTQLTKHYFQVLILPLYRVG